MKSCPTCNRTYSDETLAFCLVDGSILSAPFDPAETRARQTTRQSSPPPTEFSAGAEVAKSRGDLQSTIRAPAPQFLAPEPVLEAAPVTEQKAGSDGATLVFRLALAARGIVALLWFLPLGSISWGFSIHRQHVFFAAVLSLAAGLASLVKHKRGVLLVADGIVASIVAVAFMVSTQWPYWIASWPGVSGLLLIGAAIEMRNLVTYTWLLALSGLIFGLYTVEFLNVALGTSLSPSSYTALEYARTLTQFMYGATLTAFALLARPKIKP